MVLAASAFLCYLKEQWVMPATLTQEHAACGATRPCSQGDNYPLYYRVPVRERYGSTLLPTTREQHDQDCTQSH